MTGRKYIHSLRQHRPRYLALTIALIQAEVKPVAHDKMMNVWQFYCSSTAWASYARSRSRLSFLSTLSVARLTIIQSLFASLLPSRAQQLRGIEVGRESQFVPTYYVDLENIENAFLARSLFTEKQHSPTVWDRSHSICTPLGACFGCEVD
jgi:uncharacterized protein YjiS (DUF1127 family)